MTTDSRSCFSKVQKHRIFHLPPFLIGKDVGRWPAVSSSMRLSRSVWELHLHQAAVSFGSPGRESLGLTQQFRVCYSSLQRFWQVSSSGERLFWCGLFIRSKINFRAVSAKGTQGIEFPEVPLEWLTDDVCCGSQRMKDKPCSELSLLATPDSVGHVPLLCLS